jgi:hypothetical protein
MASLADAVPWRVRAASVGDERAGNGRGEGEEDDERAREHGGA